MESRNPKLCTSNAKIISKVVAIFLLINIMLFSFSLSACESQLIKASKPYMSFYQCYRKGCPIVCIDFTNRTDEWVIITSASCEYDGHTIEKTDIYIEPYQTITCEFYYLGLKFKWDGQSDSVSQAEALIGKVKWTAEKSKR